MVSLVGFRIVFGPVGARGVILLINGTLSLNQTLRRVSMLRTRGRSSALRAHKEPLHPTQVLCDVPSRTTITSTRDVAGGVRLSQSLRRTRARTFTGYSPAYLLYSSETVEGRTGS